MGNKASRERLVMASKLFDLFEQKEGKVKLDKALLDADEIRHLSKIDTDGDGYISVKDVQNYFMKKPLHELRRLYNRVCNKEELNKIMILLDTDGDGYVKLDDLVEFGMHHEWKRRMRRPKTRPKSKSSARKLKIQTYNKDFKLPATADEVAPITYLALKKYFEDFSRQEITGYFNAMLKVRLKSIWSLLNPLKKGKISLQRVKDRTSDAFVKQFFFVVGGAKKVSLSDLQDSLFSQMFHDRDQVFKGHGGSPSLMADKSPHLGGGSRSSLHESGSSEHKSSNLHSKPDRDVKSNVLESPMVLSRAPSAQSFNIAPSVSRIGIADDESARKTTVNAFISKSFSRIGPVRVQMNRVRLLTETYQNLKKNFGLDANLIAKELSQLEQKIKSYVHSARRPRLSAPPAPVPTAGASDTSASASQTRQTVRASNEAKPSERPRRFTTA